MAVAFYLKWADKNNNNNNKKTLLYVNSIHEQIMIGTMLWNKNKRTFSHMQQHKVIRSKNRSKHNINFFQPAH